MEIEISAWDRHFGTDIAWFSFEYCQSRSFAPGTTPSQHIPNIHNMRRGFESWWYLHLDWHLLVICLTLSTSVTKNRAAFNPSLLQRITGNYTRMNKWTVCYSSECLRKQQVCRHQMEENIIAIPASHRVTANRAINAFEWFLSFFMCFPLKVGGFSVPCQSAS